MTDKKSKLQERRKFLKTSGVGLGATSLFTAGILGAFRAHALTREDGKFLNIAAKAVEKAARKGAKGKAVSMQVQYQKAGGRSKRVLIVLNGFDATMKKLGYDEKTIDGSLDQGLARGFSTLFDDSDIGKGREKEFGVGDIDIEFGYGNKSGLKGEGSAFKTALDFGGVELREEIRTQGIDF